MNPIIALWCHPRSMSTVVERVMRERGDLECLHEPFMYFYYVERRVREMPHFDIDPSQPTSYASIREHLLQKAEQRAVFAKDMSYYVIPQVFEDTALAKRLTNCFLIRNPMKSILSYYKLDPEFTLEEVGVEAQWRHFEWLSSITGRQPIVIDAELVQQDPESLIAKFWQQIGLGFRAEAFSWSKQEMPADWNQVASWHSAAATSGRIRPHDVDQDNKARQEFDATAAKAPHLRDYLDHHRPYYDKLRAHALMA